MLDSADLEQTVKIETEHVLYDFPRYSDHLLNLGKYLNDVLFDLVL